MMNSKRVLAIVLFLSVMASAVAYPQTAKAQSETYVFRRSWGGETMLFSSLSGVTVAPNGVIYAINSDLMKIIKIDPQERTFQSFGEQGTGLGQFNFGWTPMAGLTYLAVDSKGNVFVSDLGNDRIQKFSSKNTFLSTWGTEGSGPGQFGSPCGIAVDSYDNIYVADRFNYRIQKFTNQGVYITEWGDEGTGPGQFGWLSGIAIDRYGRILVADEDNNRVQIFENDGEYIGEWSLRQYSHPRSIAISSSDIVYVVNEVEDYRYPTIYGIFIEEYTLDGQLIKTWDLDISDLTNVSVDKTGKVYLVDYSYSVPSYPKGVHKYTADGEFLITYAPFDEPGDFNYLHGLAVNGDQVFISSNSSGYTADNKIQKYTHSGSFIGEWTSSGADSVALDNSGHLFVSMGNQISKYSLNGALLKTWGSSGSGDGQFSGINDITVDNQNNVYVAEFNNTRIQKFTNDGAFLAKWGDITVYGIGHHPQYGIFALHGLEKIRQYSTSGVLIREWDLVGSFNNGIKVDTAGNIFVVACGDDKIQKYGPTGNLITEWFFPCRHNRLYFNETRQIDVAPNGYIYAADSLHRMVRVYSPGLPEPDPYAGLVLNGAFEGLPALTEWSYGGLLPVIRSSHAAQGSYSMRLGQPVARGERGQSEARANTTFYVRPEWDRPMLSFKYNMYVNDIMDYSDFFVAVQDGVGLNHLATVLRDGYQPCTPGIAPAAGTNLGWRTATYDLSAFKGQHVRLVFSNRNLWPGSWGIWTYVDDVKVIDAGPAPVPVGDSLVYLPVVTSPKHCDPVPKSPSSQSILWREPANQN